MLLRVLPVYWTPLMTVRIVESLVKGKTPSLHKTWVPISSISENLVAGAVVSEDARFFEHYGFDFEAIQKAMKHNSKAKRIRGGSTISQQVAKNVFLWPTRSYIRKALEAVFTVMIEAVWSKQRIMEVYLNIVELGDGVYGVEAASQLFFHKSASHLNAGESALLIAVLPNPNRFKVGQPSSYVRFRQQQIRKRLLWQRAEWQQTEN